MKKIFCCPECGGNHLTVVKDEKPFSLTKTIFWSWIWGVFGILFAMLSGQTDCTVSTWICEDCKCKFKEPNEAQIALEKNQRAANGFITFYEIIYIVIFLVTLGCLMLMGGFTFILGENPDNIIALYVLLMLLFGIIILAVVFIVGEVIRHFVNKYYERRIDRHMKIKRNMETYSTYTEGNFETY